MATETTTQATTSTEKPKMNHYPSIQHTFSPPLIANDNAFLGDIATSNDTTAPISSGFFKLVKGKSLTYDYNYHEMKIILDGEFIITDEGSGKTVRATKGDCFYFEKGTKIKFETENFGYAFYTGQRKEGSA